MTRISTFGIVRSLALAAAAVFALSAATGQHAQAASVITPGPSPVKAATDGLIQVRGGGGFHGFHGGGFHGGGFHAFHGGGVRFAHFGHRHHFFYGGYYPAYSYPVYAYPDYCRVVWTYYGPRRICGYRHWYRRHYYW